LPIPAEPPVIDPGYLTADADLRGLVAGLRIAGRPCDTAALPTYVGVPMAPWPGKVDDASWRRSFGNTDGKHPVGTSRMGSEDAARWVERRKAPFRLGVVGWWWPGVESVPPTHSG